MDNQSEQPTIIEELHRWAKVAKRFRPDLDPKVVLKPTPRLKIGSLSIGNLEQWLQYWNNEILAKHWDADIAALSAPSKPQNIKDLIRRLEKKKKPKEDDAG